jgi:hypothetical protein
MSPKEEILLTLKSIKSNLLDRYPIASLALFGSYSRDEQSETSDIDILVEIDGKIGSRFIDLAEELESVLGRKVDLISKNGIKPEYFKFIEHDLIYV